MQVLLLQFFGVMQVFLHNFVGFWYPFFGFGFLFIANESYFLNQKKIWSSFVEFCFVFFGLGYLFIANDSKVWCLVLCCIATIFTFF